MAGICWISLKSTENYRKKVFAQQISCGKVMEYIGHPVHRGPNIFFLKILYRVYGYQKTQVKR
jgi:hypothetical protein